MSIVLLLEKLNQIEQMLESKEPSAIRSLLIEAQQYALQVQRETPEQMRRSSRLAVTPS